MIIGSRLIVAPCVECDKHHVAGSPCKDSRKKGDPQSTTHGIQAVKTALPGWPVLGIKRK